MLSQEDKLTNPTIAGELSTRKRTSKARAANGTPTGTASMVRSAITPSPAPMESLRRSVSRADSVHSGVHDSLYSGVETLDPATGHTDEVGAIISEIHRMRRSTPQPVDSCDRPLSSASTNFVPAEIGSSLLPPLR